MKIKFKNRIKTTLTNFARCTRLFTQLSPYLNRHVGPSVPLGPAIIERGSRTSFLPCPLSPSQGHQKQGRRPARGSGRRGSAMAASGGGVVIGGPRASLSSSSSARGGSWPPGHKQVRPERHGDGGAGSMAHPGGGEVAAQHPQV
jgi:hypothetical protein